MRVSENGDGTRAVKSLTESEASYTWLGSTKNFGSEKGKVSPTFVSVYVTE